ncbi:MAG TPA: PEP/pyruvate-binding domain-containing protein [Candidatus Omnitrophota bacterium]|nr:PEP/pyruvate-binding domain-containing protein [Candidatus Omnitrophota bacterium]HPS36894.1 PEP/pyruvate-binding domain-containing protein [Candidatus Omnitrophota bacterium]
MVSTGVKGLDKVITGLQLGDNVVWQIDALHHYKEFVDPFVQKALEEKRKLVYIRFANHEPLLKAEKGIKVYHLDPHSGFEPFSAQLNGIIKSEGEGVFYVFDCLSDLLSVWSNDLMIGNFFKITCPYLFELNTIAYFALLRSRHSFKTVARIRDTTQLLIDVYHFHGDCYIHLLKVWNRYSPTMFLPHIRQKEKFVPIANSADTAKVFAEIFKRGSKSAKRNLDYWDQLFMRAEELAEKKKSSPEVREQMIDQLSRLIIARDEKILKLAKENFSLDDFLTIKSRMVGTGYIGGKTVGMLIARSILAKEKSLNGTKLFEPHDSFYIGSDVFYTYMVENGWWKEHMAQRTKEGYIEVARNLRTKLLAGVFPEEIKEQFQQMIEYFGQSPIIVRSSSLLEDSYGNAFAGKYESVFLVNQGTPDERYAKFVEAVRRIYASTMNEDALAYRLQRGLDQMDEQMALLVQRVSGAYHDDYFFPDAAGVGISQNVFVWKGGLDPKAGMLRLVLGLGTRSVNRVEGDYPRIVALDEPLLKAYAGMTATQRFSQHDVDVLDIKENILQTVPFRELLRKKVCAHLDLLAIRDDEAVEKLREMGSEDEPWILTFDNLVSKTPFSEILQKILKTLESAYGYPVDIEFTVNFKKDGEFQINLLQCRPMQTKGLGHRVKIPKTIPKNKVLFQSKGNFLGGNIMQTIDKIIYVSPEAYCALDSQSDRYDIARVIGELNRQIGGRDKAAVMLLGPGRWGTTTPSLGVPVSFSEINHITVLGEIAFVTENAAPEISFGTHFFQDLVETGIFYVALFPDNAGVFMDQKFFDTIPKTLRKLAPQYKKYEDTVKVYDVKKSALKIAADILSQKIVCFFE